MSAEYDPEFQCLLCDATVAEETDNAVDDPDEDTHMPPQWVQIVATRVTLNPDYGQENGAREAYRQSELAQLPPETPAEVREYVSQRLQALLDLIPRVEAPLTVERLEGCLCPKHAGVLQARLEFPDWDEE